MKTQWLIALAILAGCQKSEVVSEFTGNQASYGLVQASQYAVSGTVTFKERKDGSTTVAVQLNGTDGTAQLPVHLHMGDVSANGAAIAALLNSADAKTGISSTIISQLADGTKVAYKDLLKLSAYINIHAANSGPESNVILAAGNIGVNGTKASSGARMQIGVCKSN
jgi:hypothetical protein